MKYLSTISLSLIILSTTVLADEYLYLRNEPNCRLKAYKNGAMVSTTNNNLFNKPLSLRQFETHPNYVRFEVDNQIYIANSACVYLSKAVNTPTINLSHNELEQFAIPGNFKLFTMFTLSQGNFDDRLISRNAGTKIQQNSPMTFGLASNYLLNDTGQMINSSFYLSFLRTAQIADSTGITGQTSALPNEIGANLYFQSHVSQFHFSVYEGIDFEKFSSFNTKEYIEQGSDLLLNSNSIIMGTIGIGETFSLGTYAISTKLSVSQILKSTSNSPSGDTFTGQRILFFASLMGQNKFSYNFLYKRHMLKGPTQLTVDRVGFGLGYELF